MDIMLPPLGQQVSPPPWVVRRHNIDVPRLIREKFRRQSDAAIDELVADLAAAGVQVSGIIVAMWIQELAGEEDRGVKVDRRREISRNWAIYEAAIDRWTNEGGALGPGLCIPDRSCDARVSHSVGGSPA
jgi:hypothetical protein